MRNPGAHVERVAGAHVDLVHHRPQLLLALLLDAGITPLLRLEQLPGFLARQLHHEHVVGVAVTGIGLVTLLRKEHHAVGHDAGQGLVEAADKFVDPGVEDIDAFEHHGGAVSDFLV